MDFKKEKKMQDTTGIPLLARALKNQEKIRVLEEQVRMLLEQHKNILEHFRDMAMAVTEINSGDSEE
jgi:hypothetical protein